MIVSVHFCNSDSFDAMVCCPIKKKIASRHLTRMIVSLIVPYPNCYATISVELYQAKNEIRLTSANMAGLFVLTEHAQK